MGKTAGNWGQKAGLKVHDVNVCYKDPHLFYFSIFNQQRTYSDPTNLGSHFQFMKLKYVAITGIYFVLSLGRETMFDTFGDLGNRAPSNDLAGSQTRRQPVVEPYTEPCRHKVQ